ncbi:hypothetical protein K9B32_16410 [Rhizobium sp. 3T7]|uniref:hypothetical protein n=1 Tax=Rhizobium sp. 3T7 TaxID=2874922 RepID=UPI001CCF9721|nr:hypothetical protein [Rhizobium sp. 3T7]MBZ9791689.1 hypothetical protein [Rhizobium sp. 3T7]
MSQFVATTTLTSMRPVGTQAERSLQRLQAMLDKEFKGRLCFSLAEPVQRKDGAGIDWYAETDEPLTWLTSLQPELADYYRKRMAADAEKIRASAETLEARGDASSRAAATALRNTVTYPGDEHLWVAGDVSSNDATIVVTGWGYESHASEGGRNQIGKKVWMPPKLPDRPPVETSAYEPDATAPVAVIGPTPGRAVPWRWLMAELLWLLALALGLALAWLLIPACGVRLPFGGPVVYGWGGGTYCREVGAGGGDEGFSAAPEKVASLEEKLRKLVSECVPPSVVAPKDAVRQALIDHGLTPDDTATSVTLFWDNKNDLDLYLVCGAEKAGAGVDACGAKASLDANFLKGAKPLVDNPVEHITAAKGKLEPGHYKVNVKYYEAHKPAPDRVEFKVIVQQGDKYKLYPGSIVQEAGQGENTQTVAVIDVP